MKLFIKKLNLNLFLLLFVTAGLVIGCDNTDISKEPPAEEWPIGTPVTDGHFEGTSWKLAGAYDAQTDELIKKFEPGDTPHYLFTFIDDTTAYSLPSRSIHLYPGNKVIGSKGTFELLLGDLGLFDDILQMLESYVYDEEKNVFKFFYHSEGREHYLLFKQTVKTPVTDNPHFEGTSWKLAGAYDVQTDELVKEFEPRNHEIFYSFTFYTNTQARGSSASGNELYVDLLGPRVMGELTEMASATYEDANLFSRITTLIASYRFDEEENVFKFFYSDNGREYYLLFKQTVKTPVTDSPHLEGTSWKLAGAYDVQTDELVKEFDGSLHYLYTFVSESEAYTSPPDRSIFLCPENKVRAGTGTGILLSGDRLIDDILRMLESYTFDEEKNVFKFFYHNEGREYYLLFKQTVKTPVTDYPYFEGTSWKLAGAYDAQTDKLVKTFDGNSLHYLFTFVNESEAYTSPPYVYIFLYPENKVRAANGTEILRLGDLGLFDDILRLLESYAFDEEKNVFKFFYHSDDGKYYLLFKQTEL